MDIESVLKRLPSRTLKDAWRAAHTLAECESYDEFSKAAFFQINRLAPFESGAMYSFQRFTSKPLEGSYRLVNVDDPQRQAYDYDSYYWRLNPLNPAFDSPRYYNTAISWDDHCAPGWRNGEFYSGFLRKIQFEYLINFSLGFRGAPVGTISFTRPAGGRDFSDKEKAAVTLLGHTLALTQFKFTYVQGAAAPDERMVSAFARRYKLTPKEGQILCLLAQGMSNKEIGPVAAISEPTVKAHITHIFQKTGAFSRLSLLAMMMKP